jgi:hypothetical protein
MALDAVIVGTNLDTDGNIKVALPLTPAKMGGVRMFSESDPGDVTGAPLLRSPEVSMDYRLRCGGDSVWDTEQFNYVAQNTSKHKYTPTTMALAFAAGSMNTNTGNIVTAATAVQLQTYRHFPLLGSGIVYVETVFCLSNAMATNTNIDFGLMLLAGAGTSIPTDGVYFRVNASGIFGVSNNNGVEVTTTPFAFPLVTNAFAKFTASVSQTSIEFWINDVLMGTLARPVGSGQVLFAASAPYAIRHHIIGTAGAVVQGKFGGYSITQGDLDNSRLWASTMAGQGLSGVQGASGHNQGQTSGNANSIASPLASLSNVAAGYGTLGGKFQFAAVAGSEVDYALFAFLNPAASTSVTGRNLVIHGVWVDTYNAVVAVATTPTVLEWSLGVGGTAISLATAEGVNTRAPRRASIGVQSFTVGALAGALAPRLDVNLDAPLVVEPNSYVHVILRIPYGTATATELFRGQVGFNCYWE